MITAFNLVCGSPATVLKSVSFNPVFFRNNGQTCDIESPGVTATVLPLMSSGLRIFLSEKPITDIGLVCSATPTALTGAPLAAALIMVGTST